MIIIIPMFLQKYHSDDSGEANKRSYCFKDHWAVLLSSIEMLVTLVQPLFFSNESTVVYVVVVRMPQTARIIIDVITKDYLRTLRIRRLSAGPE